MGQHHAAEVPPPLPKEVDALIASAYLSGTNTRLGEAKLRLDASGARWRACSKAPCRNPLSAESGERLVPAQAGIKADWDNWNKRDLANEDIVRLILDGTHVQVRMDKKATAVSLLVVLGIRRDGQKVLLAVKNMGGESESASWRSHASHGRVPFSTI